MNWYPSPDLLAQLGHAALAALGVFVPLALAKRKNRGRWVLIGIAAVAAYAILKEFTFDLWVENATTTEGWWDLLWFGVGFLGALGVLAVRYWHAKGTYPHQGDDQRALGGPFAQMADALHFDSEEQPFSLIVQVPLGVKFYFPLGKAKFVMGRIGWRWDATAKAYIPGAALKIVDNASLY